MGGCGSCVFKAGYKLYADTCVGRYLHSTFIHRFKVKYGEGAMHSRMTQFVFGDLIIIPIPVLTNNYTYLVADAENMNFVLVDVGDISKVVGTEVQPDAILTTHRHWDHSHGNREFHATYPDLPIYGGDREKVPGATVKVSDGEVIKFGRLSFTAMWTPGHTKGHVCYLLDGKAFDSPSSLFTGDHLMLAGCGANFECSIKIMVQSLDRLTTLPEDTLIWPGHEVGLNSLLLAVYLEESNQAAWEKLYWVASRRVHKMCTCPSTIGEERLYNPFLRTRDVTLLRTLGLLKPDDDATSVQGFKRETVEMGVICYKHIIKRLRDSSEEATKKRSELVKMVFEGINLSDDEDGDSSHLSHSSLSMWGKVRSTEHHHHKAADRSPPIAKSPSADNVQQPSQNKRLGGGAFQISALTNANTPTKSRRHPSFSV